MKQKTAMMEMIEYLVQLSNSGHPLNSDYQDSILNKANELLEKEEKQMLSAFEESRLTHPMIGFKHETFIDYFNETYKSE